MNNQYYMSDPYQNKHYTRRMIVFNMVATPDILRFVRHLPQIVYHNYMRLKDDFESRHEYSDTDQAEGTWFEIAPYLDEVEAWCQIDDAIKEYIREGIWRNAIDDLKIEGG